MKDDEMIPFDQVKQDAMAELETLKAEGRLRVVGTTGKFKGFFRGCVCPTYIYIIYIYKERAFMMIQLFWMALVCSFLDKLID